MEPSEWLIEIFRQGLNKYPDRKFEVFAYYHENYYYIYYILNTSKMIRTCSIVQGIVLYFTGFFFNIFSKSFRKSFRFSQNLLGGGAFLTRQNLHLCLYTGRKLSIVFRVKYPLHPIHVIILYAGIYGSSQIKSVGILSTMHLRILNIILGQKFKIWQRPNRHS